MKFLQKFRLIHRAMKYQNRDDRGGIRYLHTAITPGDTVFDIGAHKAGYTYFIQSLVGKSGQVHCFEPQQLLFNYIEKLKELMEWDNVTIQRLAFSNKFAPIKLFIPDNKKSKGSSPGATLCPPEGRTDFNKQELIVATTLDLYCEQKNVIPNLLKIDVEGEELNVFKGGAYILSKHHPNILVEIEARHVGRERMEETMSYLYELGYGCRFIHPSGAILKIEDFKFDLHQSPDPKLKQHYCNNFIFEQR